MASLLALLLAAPDAQAGTYSATCSGGTYNGLGGRYGAPGTYSDALTSSGYGATAGVGGGGASCQEAIKTTLTWQPAYTGEPAPPSNSVIVTETCTATSQTRASGSDTASCDDGLGQKGSTQSVSGTPQYSSSQPPTVTGYFASASSTDTRYTAGGSGSISLSATPTGSVTASGAQSSAASVIYAASATPVTIGLPGTTPNTSDGSLHILIGQQCQATLNGVPSGCKATNLQWTATGNTLQGWTGGSGGGTAAISGQANPYKLSQPSSTDPGPVWYWSDAAGAKTVTCTATITPPSDQGSPFSITATQNVILDVPTWSEADNSNPTRIDSSYPLVAGPALWAGSTAAQQNGSQWKDSVTIPPNLYAGHGDWAHLQIITVSGTHDSIPVPNNGMTGLDGAFPYSSSGGDFFDNGVVQPEGDSPGINLLDTYNNYNLNYSYDLYVMYDAPGNTSIWVPLTKLTWTWSPNVTRPGTKHWSNWPVGTSPGGNPVVPAQGTRCITEPTWTTKISEH